MKGVSFPSGPFFQRMTRSKSCEKTVRASAGSGPKVPVEIRTCAAPPSGAR